jgi:hypothetical protein
LEIKNNRDAISRLDDDEKRTVGTTDGVTQASNAPVLVSESGMYNLIFQSRKPEANQNTMNITERAAKVLQEIDAALALAEKATPGPWIWDGKDVWHRGESYESKDYPHSYTGIQGDERLQKSPTFLANTDFIAASRTEWPKSLLMNKTAIEGLRDTARMVGADNPSYDGCGRDAAATLTTILDQWEAKP